MNGASLLNGLTSAKWHGRYTPTGAVNGGRGTVLTLGMSVLPRKLRRAVRSRRWEKKAVKAINALCGFEALVRIAKKEAA